MPEIRDFLKQMNVPQLADSEFPNKFEEFCENVRSNIENIVSAPFLKGDRGSGITIVEEPLRDEDGEWTEFAMRLVETIYGISRDSDGFPLIENGMVMWEVASTSSHKDNLIVPPDMGSESTTDEEKAEYNALVSLDGGPAPSTMYEFDSWASESESDPDSNGTFEIARIEEEYIQIRILRDHNHQDRENKVYRIQAQFFESETRYELIEGNTPTGTYITVTSGPIGVYYVSYQPIKDMDSILVCYSEHTGKKAFWVPLFYFDGRINYVENMSPEALSLFHDMSCVIWGSAEYMGDFTLDDFQDPDSWDWDFKKSYALPKLYYDSTIEQFCWEIAGTQSGIIAQGVKGDPGEDAKIWICVGDINDEQISISQIVSPEDNVIQNIQQGDLCIVFYEDETSTGQDWGDFDGQLYNRCQFGTAHIAGDEVFVESHLDTELITKLRSRSFHDWLSAIGDTNVSNTVLDYCAALYTKERDDNTKVMAMWADKNKQHYIAPLDKNKMSQQGDGTATNPVSGRTLNILHDKTRFPNNVRIEKEMASNETRPLANEKATLNTYDSYRLAAMINVMRVCDKKNMVYGEKNPDNMNLLVQLISSPSLYLECELIIGWVPENIAQKFNDNVFGAYVYNIMEIYRAQKIHFWVRIPGGLNVEQASLMFADDSGNITSGTSISLNNNNEHKGSGRTFTLTINPDMRYEEYNITQNFGVIRNSSTGNKAEINFTYKLAPGLIFDGPHQHYSSSSVMDYHQYYVSLLTDKQKPANFIYTYNLPINSNPSANVSIDIGTKQYRILDGGLSLSTGVANTLYRISDLFAYFWGGTPDVDVNPLNIEDITKCYPLTNQNYSFLGYFKSNLGNQFITTTKDDWMKQGWVLESVFRDKYPGYSDEDISSLYIINTTYYDTIYPSDFNFRILTSDGYATRATNTATRIYPEGLCGLQYHRIDNGVVNSGGSGSAGSSPSGPVPGGTDE